MDRVLITGADGFVAGHLISELIRVSSPEIMGIGLKKDGPRGEGVNYRELDMTRFEELSGLLKEFAPDAVFHLAAQSSVALSWRDPWETYRINLLGQLNIFEALRGAGLSPAILVTCSSDEYGVVKTEEIPLIEEHPLHPNSPYAVSKVGQETLALMYYEAFGWHVLVTRGFNQAGPGQTPKFVVSDFAKQVAEIEKGLKEPVLRVGNLEAERDFMDVRDAVAAYRMVMEKGSPGTPYNVCSGKAVSIRSVLEILLELATCDVEVRKDPERDRPSDVPVLAGDNSRILEEVGWEPKIPLEKTLSDTLDYWREVLDRRKREVSR